MEIFQSKILDPTKAKIFVLDINVVRTNVFLLHMTFIEMSSRGCNNDSIDRLS